MYVMYIYKTTSRFTSACKYKLTKLITFIFPQRYSPSKKNSLLTFSQNSKSLTTLIQSEKDRRCNDLLH